MAIRVRKVKKQFCLLFAAEGAVFIFIYIESYIVACLVVLSHPISISIRLSYVQVSSRFWCLCWSYRGWAGESSVITSRAAATILSHTLPPRDDASRVKVKVKE